MKTAICPQCNYMNSETAICKCGKLASFGPDCSTDEQSGPERSGDLTRSAEAQAVEGLCDELEYIMSQQKWSDSTKVLCVIDIVAYTRNRLRENRC